MSDDSFYVGYEERAPAATARSVRRSVAAVLLAAVAVGVSAAWTQVDTGDGRYEFGVARAFTGRVELSPYPTLAVPRPGRTAADQSFSRYPVVAFAKFGAGDALSEFDGAWVDLEAAVVSRDGITLLELVDGSVRPLAEPPAVAPPPPAGSVETIEAYGEIVDSKCFLGAMKPGLGRAHKACAELCIRGGIPPLFVGRRESWSDGEFLKALLIGPDGEAVNDRVLPLVAEPVRLRGELEERDGLHFLRVDVGTIERLESL
ncbi:MAG: hypothetical protein AAFZ65_03755 [Planctomycetota bacterium]